MNIYCLRHGIAEDYDPTKHASDADRALTPKGKKRMESIAEAMQSQDIEIKTILASPYRRAKETAEIVADQLGLHQKIEWTSDLEPEKSASLFLKRLTKECNRHTDVMLVGHEPFMSSFISYSLVGTAALHLVMKKGGLCKISFSNGVKPGTARLEWLLNFGQLRTGL